jgi:type IV secretory pathway component VirB8
MPPEQDPQEYNNFVKQSVKDGSYFKDAMDWYIFRYVNPICERTMLFFIALLCLLISYILIIIIYNSLPLVQHVPIIIKAKDVSRYTPIIKSLRDSEDIRTVDEAVVKYLLIKYLKDREEFDFRKADIEVLNKKFAAIRNNSSVDQYREFQAFMNKDNPTSPIRNWGKNITRLVKINSFSFKRIELSNFVDRAKDFMSVEVPGEVEIRYNVINFDNGTEDKQTYLARIKFKFLGIDTENPKKNLELTVVEYKNFLVK